MANELATTEPPPVEALIHVIRGQKVMLDSDLARIYGVTTIRLNEQVKRNARKFPADFAFQLTRQEFARLISQNAISKPRRGGRRHLPYVFTEHGAIMVESNTHAPHEPAVWSAAFTPLPCPTSQGFRTQKRRKRRAPVQGFNARSFSGNSHPDPLPQGEGIDAMPAGTSINHGGNLPLPAGEGWGEGESAWRREADRFLAQDKHRHADNESISGQTFLTHA